MAAPDRGQIRYIFRKPRGGNSPEGVGRWGLLSQGRGGGFSPPPAGRPAGGASRPWHGGKGRAFPASRRAFPHPFPVSRALAGGHRGLSEPSRWRFFAEFPRKCGNISVHVWKFRGNCLYSRRSQSITTAKGKTSMPISQERFQSIKAAPAARHGRFLLRLQGRAAMPCAWNRLTGRRGGLGKGRGHGMEQKRRQAAGKAGFDSPRPDKKAKQAWRLIERERKRNE